MRIAGEDRFRAPRRTHLDEFSKERHLNGRACGDRLRCDRDFLLPGTGSHRGCTPSASKPIRYLRFFARLLRDGCALAATGSYVPFRELTEATLEVILASSGITPTGELVASVIDGFAELDPHPDVEEGLEHARAAGARVIALTNGSTENTNRLLGRAGLAPLVERIVSTDEVKQWKPRREVYLHAARIMGVGPSEVALRTGQSRRLRASHPRHGLPAGG